MSIRIAVVAHTEEMAQKISGQLSQEPDFELLGAQGSLSSTEAFVSELQPDVLIICDGEKAAPVHQTVRQVQATDPRVRCLMLGNFDNNSGILTALRLGVSGVLPIDAGAVEVVSAVGEVSRGHLYISPHAKSSTEPSHADNGGGGVPGAGVLSPRESEVLTLVADGLSTQEIASRLAIGIKTVETHRSNIMKKLGLRSVAKLTKHAIRHGLTRLDI